MCSKRTATILIIAEQNIRSGWLKYPIIPPTYTCTVQYSTVQYSTERQAIESYTTDAINKDMLIDQYIVKKEK